MAYSWGRMPEITGENEETRGASSDTLVGTKLTANEAPKEVVEGKAGTFVGKEEIIPEIVLEAAAVLRLKGNKHYKAGEHEKACTLYCEALSKLSGCKQDGFIDMSTACLQNLSASEIALGRFERAVGYATEALELNNQLPKALYRRALAYTKLSKWALALDDLEEALRHAPRDVKVAHLLSQVRASVKDSDKRGDLAASDQDQHGLSDWANACMDESSMDKPAGGGNCVSHAGGQYEGRSEGGGRSARGPRRMGAIHEEETERGELPDGRVEGTGAGQETKSGDGGGVDGELPKKLFDKTKWAGQGFDGGWGGGGGYGSARYYEPKELNSKRTPSERVHMPTGESWRGLEIMGFGLNNCGQLGIPLSLEQSSEPLPFAGGASAVAVSCGEGHSAFALQGGGVAGVGSNDSGQLGARGGGDHVSSLPIEAFVRLASGLKMEVASVSCGAHFTMALLSDDQVYAWGENSFGQLGLGHASDVMNPQRVQGLCGKEVSIIACGDDHVLALSRGGGLRACGSNRDGQLGVGLGTERQEIPSQVDWAGGVEQDSVVVDVACGSKHSLLLTGGGIVLSFGDNSHGQLGLGAAQKQMTASRVPMISSNVHARGQRVACGRRHSAVLLYSGDVLACGDNRQGQLGMGHTRGECRLARIPKMTAKGITAIFAGGDTTIGLNAHSGAAYACGYNEDGQLGLGHLENVLEPTLMCEGSKVVTVACGYYHTIIGLRSEARCEEGEGEGENSETRVA